MVDLNAALKTAGLESRLMAVSLGTKIAIGPTAASDVTALQIGGYENSTQTVEQLGYMADAVIGLAVLKAAGRPTLQLTASSAPTAAPPAP